MTIRVLIADDEEAPRAQMRAALARVWPQASVVAMCEHGVDAWDSFLEHEPQVCFLDIRMPGLTGLEVAKKILDTGAPTHIVFCTAFGDHALQAFDAGAVDYVMKPVDDARLALAVQRVQQRLAAPVAQMAGDPLAASQAEAASNPALMAAQLAPVVMALLAQNAKPPLVRTIQASVGKEIKLIAVQDVIYLEADTRYTRVVYAGGEALIRTPLKELLVGLDTAQFWQIHRSAIVNSAHVASAVRLDEGLMHVTLKGRSEKLAVSRHFQALFKGQ